MQTAIPQEFKDYAEKLLGEERYGRFEQALYDSPSVSVRMNTNKVRKIFTPSECPEFDTVVPWATAGFYLKLWIASSPPSGQPPPASVQIPPSVADMPALPPYNSDFLSGHFR